MTVRYNTQHWIWGRLQWGHNIDFLTPEAEEELKRAKAEHPEIDFEELARDVKAGKLKPRV